MDSKWVTGGQNVMYHNWNADGRELCFSHHSLLTHRLACQPSQRKLSQYTRQFGKPPCCLKSNCSMWWILQSLRDWEENNKQMTHRLFTLTKACLNLMLDGTRITKRSLKALRSKNPLTDSYYSCEAICIHDKIPHVYSQDMYPSPQTNAVNFILTFCIPRIQSTLSKLPPIAQNILTQDQLYLSRPFI